MAKRFFYISLGILALTIAYNLGAGTANAGNAGDPFPIGNMVAVHEGQILSEDGAIWACDASGSWFHAGAVPIPTSDVAHYTPYIVVSRTGDVYRSPMTNNDDWILTDPFPGSGGTATEKSSWGDIKKEFR